MRLRRLSAFLLSGLAACVSGGPAPMTPAPQAPAYLKDQPSETRNGLPVNFTQADVRAAVAPELLTKGIRTARGWETKRRPELLQLLTETQYGVPVGRKEMLLSGLAWDYSERDAPAFDGKALRSQMTLVEHTGDASHTTDVLLYTPAKAKGSSPIVLMVNFSPNAVMVDDPAVKETDSWTTDGKRIPGRTARAIAKQDIMPFLDRGYGVAMVYYSQIEPDFKGGSALGVRKIFGDFDEDARAPDDAGAIATWAAHLSLVRQTLAMNPSIDGKRIALYGISRLGKAVLWAGAIDQGFAAVIAVCSGEGGGALSRRNYGETIGHVAANFPYWFSPRWNGYASDPAASPVDAHMVMAMMAPRPLMIITGETDAWSDPWGEFLAARLATPAWQLFGKRGVDAAPELDVPTGGDLTYLIHTGGHGPAPRDTPAILNFLDQYLPKPGGA